MTFNLNSKQKEAINHVEGPLLVLAGAGSGKTSIITHRISYLLSIGVPSSEILAVTFTNKAAGELKERIKKLSNQYILASTFHSLGARILRECIQELGYENNFTIYDEEDSYKLLKECFKTLNIKEDRATIQSVKQEISVAKNSILLPSDLKKDPSSSHAIYEIYEQKLKQHNAVDFDDLIFKTILLLRTSEKARNYYQNKWRFLLVDEYQDTNTSQYVLIRLLSHKHNNIFVVGDPDQSIYSWRGANINNILNFEHDFESTKIVKLEQNYRSTSHILSAANSLIKNNASRYEKNLWSDLGEGEKVFIKVVENEQSEALFVVKQILKHLSLGASLKDMVIFYRTNAQSRLFEDFLIKEALPYTIIGGISFYQRKEIKDILAYLKCSLYESDFISFARVINLPKRGLGPTFIENLANLSERTSLPIITLCRRLSKDPKAFPMRLSFKQQESLKDFVSIIDEVKKLDEAKAPLKEMIKSVIINSKYLNFLKEDLETFYDRKENLDALVSKSTNWQHETHSSNLGAFLEELSLKSNLDEQNNYIEKIQLMSLHNGKGLEYNICFIVGLEEDLLPHINSKEAPSSLEEERRLLYVGMTRAKKHLYLSSSKYRLFWGSPKAMNLSRFIKELDKNHIEGNNTDELYELPLNFSQGSKVLHKDFGVGIIKKIYQTSLGDTYDVYFQELHATKSLVAKFAKLQIL